MSIYDAFTDEVIEGMNALPIDILNRRFDDFDKLRLRTKEEPKMEVSYNGFTGELVKLERVETVTGFKYHLSIYDRLKQATHSFDNVKVQNVKFMGGTVTFE